MTCEVIEGIEGTHAGERVNHGALIEQLWRDGFTLLADGDRLRVVPASRLTDEQRQGLQLHREAILRTLREGSPLLDPAVLSALDAYEPDFDGPVALRELVVVDMGGRWVAVDREEHEATVACLREYHEALAAHRKAEQDRKDAHRAERARKRQRAAQETETPLFDQ
jgi:hypothetical protein